MMAKNAITHKGNAKIEAMIIPSVRMNLFSAKYEAMNKLIGKTMHNVASAQ